MGAVLEALSLTSQKNNFRHGHASALGPMSRACIFCRQTIGEDCDVQKKSIVQPGGANNHVIVCPMCSEVADCG